MDDTQSTNDTLAITRIPPEVWILIFQPLVTHPPTCNALTLTSKFFHDIATTIRLSTLVASFDISQLTFPTLHAFVRMLEGIPDEKRRVAHLFVRVYNTNREKAQRARSWQLLNNSHVEEWTHTFNELTHHLNRVLALIAPTLRSLTIFLAPYTTLPALTTSLPHLHELTFFVSYPITRLPSQVIPLLPQTPFPTLKRVHLAYRDSVLSRNTPEGGVLSHHLYKIAFYAPNLTHLCLSGPQWDLPHPSHFAVALGLRSIADPHHAHPWENQIGEPLLQPFPETFQKLVMRLRLPKHGRWTAGHMMKMWLDRLVVEDRDLSKGGVEGRVVVRDFDREMWAAWRMSHTRLCGSEDEEVVEERVRNRDGPYSFEEAREEWEDRVWGGRGCWGEDGVWNSKEGDEDERGDYGFALDGLRKLFAHSA
ncbi:hypothetical protein JAAARDRAFT_31486 [Jaapia argillacea MUCL 33604]|uniref:Uncharacterized protein n=1 Tax=Jaapia argillacea MUCL 33604 TaxID=933084 RepID=A0A067Q772_9AGAM|nr:hypothetical protein JAAARDRAFT_31486 [Jaapia argillacea MUCL 33604]